MPSDALKSTGNAPPRGARAVNWALTVFNGLLFIPAAAFSLRALYVTAPGFRDEGLMLYMNMAIVLLPITVIIAVTTAWIYHRGGWHRTSYYCHAAPLVNIALVVLLRLGQ